jgi:hypothetical protein
MRNEKIAIFLLTIFAFSCGGGGGGGTGDAAGGQAPIKLGYLDVSTLQGTFEVNNTSSGSSSLMGTGIVVGASVSGVHHFNPNQRAVKAVNENGAIVPPPFRDDLGNDVSQSVKDRIRIKKMMPLNEKYSVAVVQSDSETKSFLVDNQDDSLQEISQDEKSLEVQSVQIHNDHIFYYVPDIKSIVRFNLNTNETVSMNDPEEFEIVSGGSSFFHLQEDRNNRREDTEIVDFLVTGSTLIAVDDNSSLIASPAYGDPAFVSLLLPSDHLVTQGGGIVTSLIQGEDGHLYKKWIKNADNSHVLSRVVYSATAPHYQETDVLGNITAQTGNNIDVCIKADYSIQSIKNRRIIYRNGFYEVDKNGSGEPVLSWTALDLSDIPTGRASDCAKTRNRSQISGNHIYWYKDGKLKKMEIQAGANEVEVYDDSDDSVENFDVVGGNVYLVKDDGTYLLKDDGSLEKIAEVDLEISNVVDFTNFFKED